MNINQKRAWMLLKEIIDICDEGDIPWFLTGRAAIRAYNKDIFMKGFLDVEITIPIESVDKFLCIFKKKDLENRVVESLLNNSNFPGFYLRYVDTSTTLIRMNEGDSIKHKGIFVKIEFLRKEPLSLEQSKLAFQYEQLICDTANQAYIPLYDYSKTIKKKFERQRKAGGTRFTGKLFLELKNIYSEKVTDKVFVYSLSGTKVFYPQNRFNNLTFLLYENSILHIPDKAEEYFQGIAGDEWKEKAEEIILDGKNATMIVEGANNIVSTKFSYESFQHNLRQNGIDARFFKVRRKNSLKNSIHKELSVSANKVWNLAQRAGDLWLAYDEYENKKTKILNLFEVRQLDELKEIFAKYDELVRKYAQLGMGFYYDKNLWEIYIYLLRAYNENIVANRISKLMKTDGELELQIANMETIIRGEIK